MGCCRSESKVRPFKAPSDEEQDEFYGPLEQRECRDVIFLIIFIAFICGIGGVTYIAVKQGNPYRLVYGVDSYGNVCNQKNVKIENVPLSGEDNSEKPKVFFFDPTYFTSLLPDNPFPSFSEDDTEIICVEKCPPNDTEVLDFFKNEGVSLCRYDVTPYVNDIKKCPATPVQKHKSVFNRCIPEQILNSAKAMASTFTSVLSNSYMGSDFPKKVVSDMKNTWKEIGYLSAISVGVALLVVVLMRFLAAIIVWTLVIAVMIFSIGASAYCWYSWYGLHQAFKDLPASEQTDEAKQTVQTWLIYAAIVTAAMIIILLVLLVLRKRIALVVQLYKEAGRAIGRMPCMLLLPFTTLIFLIAFVGGLCLVATFVETSGLPEVKKNGHVKYVQESFWETVMAALSYGKRLLKTSFYDILTGYGVIAQKQFKAGEFLLQYCGEKLSAEDGVSRLKKSHSESKIFFYNYGGKELCIDAEETMGHLCQMVNDAPDKVANSVMKLKVFGNTEYLCLYTLKDIQPGEEIVYNYGDEKNLWWRKKDYEKRDQFEFESDSDPFELNSTEEEDYVSESEGEEVVREEDSNLSTVSAVYGSALNHQFVAEPWYLPQSTCSKGAQENGEVAEPGNGADLEIDRDGDLRIGEAANEGETDDEPEREEVAVLDANQRMVKVDLQSRPKSRKGAQENGEVAEPGNGADLEIDRDGDLRIGEAANEGETDDEPEREEVAVLDANQRMVKVDLQSRPKSRKYLRWYNIFAMLWISSFVVACQDMVIAGAVATWYFTKDKKNLGCPIAKSIKRLIRYHLGSIAFGSFIIALVKFARLILGYIQRKLQGRAGKVVDFILKCLQFCLWCFEKFLKYLNRNAYIEIAIYGYNFCKSAQKAFMIIVSNALRVAAINSIGDLVLFLGKLSTVAVVMVVGREFFKGRDDINYMWVPISVACAFAFAVSHCFMLIYEITIDTIFLCFCEDCERNNGQDRPYFMSKNLMVYLDKAEKAENTAQMKNTKKNRETTKV